MADEAQGKNTFIDYTLNNLMLLMCKLVDRDIDGSQTLDFFHMYSHIISHPDMKPVTCFATYL